MNASFPLFEHDDDEERQREEEEVDKPWQESAVNLQDFPSERIQLTGIHSYFYIGEYKVDVTARDAASWQYRIPVLSCHVVLSC